MLLRRETRLTASLFRARPLVALFAALAMVAAVSWLGAASADAGVNNDSNLDAVFANDEQKNRVCLGTGSTSTCAAISPA